MNKLKMFNDNIKLVSYTLNRLYKRYDAQFVKDNYYDMWQEGALGLWKAVHKFDDTLGYKFITYAYYHIAGHVRRYCSKKLHLRSQHKYIFISIDEEISEGVTLADTIPYIEPEDVDWILNDKRLTSQQKEICKLYLEGLSQDEVAKRIGCSQITISRTFKRIGKILLEDL